MIGGAQGITNAVMRILAAGCWPGAIESARRTIAETIVRKVGETALRLAVATLILTAVGVSTWR